MCLICEWLHRLCLDTSAQTMSIVSLVSVPILGPFRLALTFNCTGASLPIRILHHKEGSVRQSLGNRFALSGVTISCLSWGILAESIRRGSFDVLPSIDRTEIPEIRCPDLWSFTAQQVDRRYLNPLRSISDQRPIAVCYINAFSVREVMRTEDMTTQHESQIKKFSTSLLFVMCGNKKGEFAV